MVVGGIDGGWLLLILLLFMGGIGVPPPPFPLVACEMLLSFAGVIGILITPVEFMKDM